MIIEYVSENKIIITDNKGARYYFGQYENNLSIERSRVTQNGRINTPSIEFPSSWLLIKAEDSKGKSILFEYETYTTRYCNLNHETNYSLKSGSYIGTCSISNEYNTDSYVIFGNKIKRITWEGGKIEYIYSSEGRTDLNTTDNSLVKIEIWDDKNETNYKFCWKLFYGYFNLNNGQSDPCSAGYSGPLKLTKIQQFTNSELSLPPFEFVYNNSVPGRASKAVDHWGFYNGVTTNNTLIPELSVNNNGNIILLSGADRQPRLAPSMAGILKSIIYPTGGTTEFEFESHIAYTSSFSNEPSVEVENILYATVSKNDLTTLPIKKIPFNVPSLTVLNNIQGAWVNISVMVDVPCDPSVREGGCGGEVYVSPSEGSTGTTWTFGGNESVSGQITRKVFLKAGSYDLVMRSFGDPVDIKYLYANVFGPDPNLVDEELNYNRIIGGVRIKSIINKIGTSIVSKKQYYYHRKDNYTISSGVLVDQPIYLSEFRINQGYELGDSLICVWYARHSNSKIPLGITQGSHIGYSYVAEDEVNPITNLVNGRTTYEFTTANDWPDFGNLGLPYPPRTSLDMRRGKLIEKSFFRSVGENQFELLKKISYKYLPVANQTTNYYQNIYFACAQIDLQGNCEKIAIDKYEDISLWEWKSNETYIDYVSVSNFLKQETVYEFSSNLHKLPTSISHKNSAGVTQTTTYKYALDFDDADLDLVTRSMKNDLNMNSLPLRITSKIEKPTGVFIVNDIVYKYGNISNSKIGIVETYKLNLNSPIPESSLPIYKPVSGVSSNYSKEILFNYNFKNNVNEINRIDGSTSIIWSGNGEYPLAKITNTSVGHVAFTSFEADSDGNWSIPDNTRNTVYAFSGFNSYSLTGNNNIVRTDLSTQTNYIVSYWTRSGSALVNGFSGQLVYSVDGWTLWRHVVTGSTQVVVSGTNLLIDELRLYPEESQMSTYAYDPLVGVVSEVDVSDKLTSYEYDGFGRLILVRDMYKNILKMYCYNYFGQIEDCSTKYFNVEKSTTVVRNNCPVGYAGSQVVYTVPAGIYQSDVSQEAADLLATNDILANAQNYANVNGQCIVSCSTSNCSGVNKKCINNVCETGIKVLISTVQIETKLWECTYQYRWSDGTWSASFVEESPTKCMIEPI